MDPRRERGGHRGPCETHSPEPRVMGPPAADLCPQLALSAAGGVEMLRLRNYAIVLAVALVAAGCGSSGGVGGVSLDQEWQLGNQLAAQVQQQVRLINDPVALSYVRSVGERIHSVTPLANRPFNFYIVDDHEVNAFSLPGGHIYVNRGLIDKADKADELAAVLGHEVSHVVARHAIKQAEQAQEINAVGSILLGNNPNALASLA